MSTARTGRPLEKVPEKPLDLVMDMMDVVMVLMDMIDLRHCRSHLILQQEVLRARPCWFLRSSAGMTGMTRCVRPFVDLLKAIVGLMSLQTTG